MAGAPYYNPVFGVLFTHQGSLAPVGGPRPQSPSTPIAIQPGGGPVSVGNPVGSGGQGPAVQAGISNIPRGSPQERTAVQRGVIAPPIRDDEWRGIRTDAPESELPQQFCRIANNWDDTRIPGSPAVRRGLMKLSDNRETINSGAYAAYFGCGILGIEPFDQSEASAKGGIVLVSLASVAAFGAASTNAGWLVRTSPMWAPPKYMMETRTLSIVVSSPSAGTIRVIAVDSTGVDKNTVSGLTIRASRSGYPVDVDGKDELDSVVLASKYRTAWNGASTGNLDTGSLATGPWFVSAWAHSALDDGERAIGKVTVS